MINSYCFPPLWAYLILTEQHPGVGFHCSCLCVYCTLHVSFGGFRSNKVNIRFAFSKLNPLYPLCDDERGLNRCTYIVGRHCFWRNKQAYHTCYILQVLRGLLSPEMNLSITVGVHHLLEYVRLQSWNTLCQLILVSTSSGSWKWQRRKRCDPLLGTGDSTFAVLSVKSNIYELASLCAKLEIYVINRENLHMWKDLGKLEVAMERIWRYFLRLGYCSRLCQQRC